MPAPKNPPPSMGEWGEQIAAHWLEQKGFVVVARNWRVRGGEVDIITRRNDELHFVEVKARSSGLGGHPEERVDSGKQAKIQLAASEFLLANPELQKLIPCFDVIAIAKNGDEVEIKWLEDAFGEVMEG